MARSKPFCNLTSFYFSISPIEYYNNLKEEEWGCFKHVGMPREMYMKMPIQERRFFIHKHNVEQDMINREIEGNSGSNTRTYEGESINSFAKLEQNNVKRG